MEISKIQCPGCGTDLSSPVLTVADQPATLNYRYLSKEKAAAAKLGQIDLYDCSSCGLVFNGAFDPDLVSYDENYDNRQAFSGAFLSHLDDITEILRPKIPKKGARILEVGCGKGDFLKRICERFDATGVGYDTSYEVPEEPEPSAVTFSTSYLTAEDVDQEYDLVICRHVVEHVPEIGAFLKELSAIACAAGNAPLLIETPDFNWIIEESAFWDIFYEHCNYFSQECLAGLCRRNDLSPIVHDAVFGGQYQLLLLDSSGEGLVDIPASNKNGNRVKEFCEQIEREKDGLSRLIEELAPNGNWMLWGSGAKGVTLASLLTNCPPSCLIDSNPDKQGRYTPGSTIPVVSPEQAIAMSPGLIVCANPNYAAEIQEVLAELKYSGKFKTI